MSEQHQGATTNDNEAGIRLAGYLSQALHEVALDIGGENLAAAIKDKSSRPDTPWPDPAALTYLEATQPGSAGRVFTQAEHIQAERLQRERAETRKCGALSYFDGLLAGLGTFSIFGQSQKLDK